MQGAWSAILPAHQQLSLRLWKQRKDKKSEGLGEYKRAYFLQEEHSPQLSFLPSIKAIYVLCIGNSQG
jgi:hypothetical protein